MSVQDRVLETIGVSVGIDDRLELLGVLLGGFVAVAGLATIVGMTWVHKNSLTVAGVQILGSLLTVAIGLGLIWLVRTG